MNDPVQPRAIKTRTRLQDTARAAIAETGYTALRVEEVVRRAGVAKGTFFAHFKDKDALMELLIAAEMDRCLDTLETGPAPQDTETLIHTLMPLMTFMTGERYVFDVILRHSGAAARQEIGPIALALDRLVRQIAGWIAAGDFRRDADPLLLAEGVQAFMAQAMALNFCALHETIPLATRLAPFLALWLKPETGLDPQRR